MVILLLYLIFVSNQRLTEYPQIGIEGFEVHKSTVYHSLMQHFSTLVNDAKTRKQMIQDIRPAMLLLDVMEEYFKQGFIATDGVFLLLVDVCDGKSAARGMFS